MPTRQWHAQRRAKRLHDHQMSLPPEQRIVNRTDWDQKIEKTVPIVTLNAREDVKQRFVQLATNSNFGMCQTTEEALSYFTRSGTPFTTAILRKFAHGIAVSSSGYTKFNMSARSLVKVFTRLWGLAKTVGNPVHRDAMEATVFYIYGPLVVQGITHTTAESKMTPVPEDLTAFTKAIFTPRFATMLSSTREILLLALFVRLQIDCSARLSELVMPSMAAKNVEAYKAEQPETMFRWSCVKVYAFPNHKQSMASGGRVTLMAQLTFRSIEDVVRKGYNLKILPLRLLPPALVADDSLFWLVTLGLIDQVFDGISSWADIDKLQPGENGLLLKIKVASQQDPVFRSTNYHAASGEDLINKDQMMSQGVIEKLYKLSRLCGLNYAMLPSVLRRGSDYISTKSVTAEERKLRMGHKENSTVYRSSYLDEMSTVDFKALRHKIEKENVVMMFSASFNPSVEDPPPSRVSDEGMTEVLTDTELTAIMTEKSTLFDELLTEYGSLNAAQSQAPARHQQYTALQKRYHVRFVSLQQQRYTIEYKAWWASKNGGSQPKPAERRLVGGDGCGGSTSTSEIDQPAREPQDCDSITPTEPQLLKSMAEASAAADALVMDMENAAEMEDDEDLLDGVQATDSASSFKEEGHARASASETKGRKFILDDRDVPRHTLVDHLPSLLHDQAATMTWAELSDVCTTTFNHLHGPDRFYPNQEPLLGTWQCRFCDMSFLGKQISPPEFHSLMCEAHHLLAEALKALQRGDSTAIERCSMGGGCSYSLNNITDLEFESHLSTSRHYSSDPEPTYICRNHSTPLVFHSRYDYKIHAVASHSAPSTILSAKSTSWEALLYFCHFCQVLIPRADELEEHHLQAHLDSGDATASIVDHGFVGFERNGRWTYPGFCIFCLFNTRLSALRRFMVWSSLQALFAHVNDEHVDKITDPVSCPAAGVSSTPEGLPQCVDTGIFDAAGMSEHLKEVHGYQYRSNKKAAQTANPGVKRKSALAVEKAPEEDMLAEDPSSDVVQAPCKKVKTGGGRQPLADLDVKQAGKQL